MLKGKKTYVLGFVTIISAAASYAVGDVSLVEAVQLVVTAALGMTVRNAIPNL